MQELVLTLDSDFLENPDLDLRYVIPDLLAARSDGNIEDNGFDYEDKVGSPDPLLAIFLLAKDLSSALKTIKDLVLEERVMDNNLAPAISLYVINGSERSRIVLEKSDA